MKVFSVLECFRTPGSEAVFTLILVKGHEQQPFQRRLHWTSYGLSNLLAGLNGLKALMPWPHPEAVTRFDVVPVTNLDDSGCRIGPFAKKSTCIPHPI
jgi:hypothetical protein